MRAVDIKNIQEVLKANANIYFEPKLSIKLAKLKVAIDEQTKIYNDVLKRLLDNFAIKENEKYKTDEEGNILIKEDKLSEWAVEYEKMEKADFPVEIKFTADELSKIKMTPSQALSLLTLEDPEN